MAVSSWPSVSCPPAMSVLLLLPLLTLQLCVVYGNYEHTCTVDTRSRGAHPNGICGKNLAQIVSVVCSPRGYVSNWFSKRSAPNRPENGEGLISDKLRGILLNKKEALSYLHRRDRQPRATGQTYGSQGITCECCYNQCTYYELLQYCN